MATPPADRLGPVEAADALVWGLEEVAHAVNHVLDPTKVRQEVRACMGTTTSFGPRELLESFRLAANSLRLTATALTLTARDLVTHSVPFPLVTIMSGPQGPKWYVITEKHGFRLNVQVGHEAAVWMDEATLLETLGPAPIQVVHCVPATPMDRLSGALSARQARGSSHHDPEPGLPPWSRVWGLLTLERDDIAVIVTYSAVVGVLSLATPIAVQSLVGTVAFGTLLQPIVVLALLFLVALGFQAVLKALQARVVEALQVRLFARVALDVAWRLPRAVRDDHPITPETVNRFFDVMVVQKAMATILTDGLTALMQIVIGLLVLAFYHPALLALDIVILSATILFILVPVRRGVSSAMDESTAKYEVAAWLEELARAPAAFRGSGGAALAVSRADALTRKYLAARRRHFRVVFGQIVSALGVQVLASAVLLGFGGYLVITQSLTLGQLIAAELIVAAVTASITKFGKILESTYDLVIGLAKIGKLIDADVDGSMTGETLPGKGPVGVKLHELDVEGVKLSLDVKPGARVAIVGAQGGALSELIAGVRDIGTGILELGGVDVRRANTCALHDEVVLVRADDLFAGTVFENVSLTRSGVTPSEVRSAVERVGLDDDIRALPDGYDTELGPLGVPLTTSQAVRLVVARALASSPRLIVVDDSLDGLDPVSRARTVAALTRRDAPWTLIALVSDPGSALARGCTEVRDLRDLSSPVPPTTPADARHS